MNEFFRRAARTASSVLGSAWAFTVAVLVVLVWAALGPVYHFSDTWQLVINTGTTIVTFLMVFLIQNTQNRDSKALHLKIDELIYAMKEARTGLVALEELSDAELEKLERDFRRVARREAHKEAKATVAEEEAKAPGGVTKKQGLRKTG
ncbi:MAG TPA: low affinity iron permease family protein [Thermoanaerobaculia bacterium]|jgi:low affinity Fe/Cu permease|nr:low affinity iron permease family protein [Thermoanaerobaculia bacterium]